MPRGEYDYVLLRDTGDAVLVKQSLNLSVVTTIVREVWHEYRTRSFVLQDGHALRKYAQRVADTTLLPVSLRRDTMFLKKSDVLVFADRKFRQAAVWLLVGMLPVFPSGTSVWQKMKFFGYMAAARIAGALRWFQGGETELSKA